MKKRTKKISLIAVLIIIVAVIGISVFSGGSEEITKVQADLAYNDKISEIVTASGRIQPQTKVNITSEVSAEIIKLMVREGDFVTKGTPLLLLDTVQYKSDAEQAEYSLDEIKARASAAKAQFEKDDKEYTRKKSLYAKNLSSETELIDAEFAFKNSKANYEAYQAQVKTAIARTDKSKDNLNKTTITAPMDGVVIYLDAEIGEIAQAQTSFTQGKTLMTIADLAVYEVEVDIDETQIANVKYGQQVEIRVDAFDDSLFTGQVIEIGNSATVSGQGTEEFTTAFRVKIRCGETGVVIRPGMSATVDITTASEDNAFLIPYASVVLREFNPDSLANPENYTEKDEGSTGVVHAATTDESPVKKKGKAEMIKKRGVYIIENGKAKFVEVETGIADERNIVVLNGLNPGDTVISGSFKTLRALKENDDVTIDQVSLDRINEGY